MLRDGITFQVFPGLDLSTVRQWNTSAPFEWDNVVLYGQYILDRKLVRRRRDAKRVVLSV
jgi:hypothetical protein